MGKMVFDLDKGKKIVLSLTLFLAFKKIKQVIPPGAGSKNAF